MAPILKLLTRNRNYRNVWAGQVVSETGDYFNNVAVLALVMEASGSGLVVSGVMLSRAIPAVIAGPIAGVLLDRFDRKRIMIASDLFRAAAAAGFLLAVAEPRPWLLYLLSALLMFASPFFNSGRNAILPSIADKEELHTANSLTQTTQWATQTLGALLAGLTAARLGYEWSFILNAASFLVSAMAIARLSVPEGFRPKGAAAGGPAVSPWRDYRQGLAYMLSVPLIFGIGMISVGWAMGGGAAQVLFALFGEQVFHRGAAGIGALWSFAGLGLLAGGAVGHLIGKRVGFSGYKRTISIAYISHGLAYVVFSRMRDFGPALGVILLSRVGMSVSSVLNYSYLLRYTREEYRGRVFATMETLRWGVMMVSFAAAGIASRHWSPREIGVAAGVLGALTGAWWAWANWKGKLPEPAAEEEAAGV